MGYSKMYLGQSVPINCLKPFVKYGDKITFITYFTVAPAKDKIQQYINEFHKGIISNCNVELWVMGRKDDELDKIELFTSIKLLHMPNVITKSRNLQSTF